MTDALLDLQRAAGNAAVVAHLAGVQTGNAAAPHLLPIQRCGPTPGRSADERADYPVEHPQEAVIQRNATDDLAGVIAKDLADYAAQNRNPFAHIREVFHGLDSDIEDNVAAAFTEKLGAQQLEGFAMTADGRSVLGLLTEAMLTGHVTSFEALQADRILAARDRWMSADEHRKAVLRIAELRHRAEDSAGQMLVNEMATQVATTLETFVTGGRYGEVTTIIRDSDSAIEDNVASHLIELLTTPQLEEAARNEAGKTMLDVCYDALITGTVTTFENLQGERILAARVKGRDIRPDDVEKVLQNPTVFPLETSWDSSATIVASLETDGTVKVYYDTHIGARRPKYAKEIATLTARFGDSAVFSGMILKPDEIVVAKLYDQDEAMVPVPAIKLIDMANRQLQDFEGKFEKVTILGATVGLGAVGGAGVLGALDTAAFAISGASIVIDAYRSDIGKTAGGRAFLEVWDVVQGVADLYGWARLGADGLHLLRAKVAPVLRDWRAEPLSGLSDAERAAIGQGQRAAENWLGGVEQAETAEAKMLPDGERAHPENVSTAHPSDAREPGAPHGASAAGPAAAHEASRVVGEAGSDIHVHNEHIVVCQLCEELPGAVGGAIHDQKVGSEVTEAEKAAAQGDAAAAVTKAESAVLDAEHVNNEILTAQKKRFRREFKSDPTLLERWDRAKAMRPGPERAAAIAEVDVRASQVRTANDQYVQPIKEKVAGLKERAAEDPAAVEELTDFYATQPEWVLDELRAAENVELGKPWRRRDIPKPKRDPLLDKALTKKQAESAMARAIADEQRHVPHHADVVVVGSGGETVVPERHFVSGGVTEAERAEHGLNEANTRSHTEAKALREIGVQADQTMYIYGQYDPCPFCRRRMQAAVNQSGGKVVYIWQGGLERFSRK